MKIPLPAGFFYSRDTIEKPYRLSTRAWFPVYPVFS